MTYKKRPNNKIMTLTQEKRIMSKPKIVLSGVVENGPARRKIIPSVTESEEWFTQTAQNSASKVHHRRSSRDILVRLYSLWQPQNSESYRPSAVEKVRSRSTRTPENPRNQKGAKKDGKESRNGRESSRSMSRSKLRVVESVVETIHHLQKSRSKRTASESTSPTSSVVNSKAKEQFKKTVQQTIETVRGETT